MKRIVTTHSIMLLIMSFFFAGQVSAQFIDDFNGTFTPDPDAMSGWAFSTGDGSATIDFQPKDGYASIQVDATSDQRNIWWAIIRRHVSSNFDLSQLNKTGYDLRIEARIRVSHAPRRVNLHLNTQRTTDFHSHLMEFDIPDTLNWHTISMTTRDFDAVPGDRVYGQLALMDWGLEKYRVDVDYFKVDIVNRDTAGKDKGVILPYRPPIPALNSFSHHIKVDHDGMIDHDYPDSNFNNWNTEEETGRTILLTVNGTQYAIMRWDLKEFPGKAVGSGLLELTTHSLQRLFPSQKDFGMVRVTEIIGGDPYWDQKDVTFNSLLQGQPLNNVVNSQMVIDIEVAKGRNNQNLITISNPVLQRLIDGKTLGLAIRPLGAISVSFYAMENQDEKFSAKLHFNVDSDVSNVK